jgi:hypothetical protein
VSRLRGGKGTRRRVRIGAPDESLTAVSGMVAVSELCQRLGVIKALDAAVGSIKQRDRGHSAGGLLVGLAAAQLAGQDHRSGWIGWAPMSRAKSWCRWRGWARPPRRDWPGGSALSSGRRWRPGCTR